MKRSASTFFALHGVLIASCQLPPPAGMAPTTTQGNGDGMRLADRTFGAADQALAADPIDRGAVGNAVSGTLELPVDLRKFSQLTAGAPPVTIHAFRVNGAVVREATATVFWKDEHTVAYIMDGIPSDVPLVLAATIEPGFVVRALVPRASRERPARGQRIDLASETAVLKSYLLGIIPPVGLGGSAEVVRQGGLDPVGAADANSTAAAALERLAGTDWGRAQTDLQDAAVALRGLARAQRAAAEGLAGASASSTATTAVYAASLAADAALSRLEARIDERARTAGLPLEAEASLAEAAEALRRAAATNRPKAATLVEPPGVYNLAQTVKLPFPYRFIRQTSQGFLADLYERVGFLSAANTGFANPNGVPFSEAEIEAAFTRGRGPYRTTCSQVNLYGDTNCRVVSNPLDRSQEVLLTREMNFLETKLKALEAAVAQALSAQGASSHWSSPEEHPAVAEVLFTHPAIANFIADDAVRWRTPIGTWRLRLLQDTGSEFVGNGGFPVINDSEMYIALPGRAQRFDYTDPIYSGAFTGALSIWLPNHELPIAGAGGPAGENLTNFSLRFFWDEASRTLTEGEIRGERRDFHDGSLRTDYTAEFDADMVSNNRILGFWYNEEERIAGRFEMIRGTARFTMVPEPPKEAK